ncbi:MAG: twin-arginine translocation signal domain-containing protein, partial [Dehalococcoidia bacterium]|nr:twin-arginine translocation signal domain-containing protein [Dehalococcoidia bacterium]
MAQTDNTSEKPQATLSGEERGKNTRAHMSRRKFLGLLGVTAAGAVAIPRIPDFTASAAGNEAISATRRLRRWCMVVDLRRCDGCVGLEKPPQCTQACNLAHYVPEGMEWVEVYHTEINKHSG